MPATVARPSAAPRCRPGRLPAGATRRGMIFLRSSRAGERRRAARQHRAAARVGAGCRRQRGAVALHDADILDAAAEIVGDDLRQRRLQALAVRGDAESRGDRAGRVDADRWRVSVPVLIGMPGATEMREPMPVSSA